MHTEIRVHVERGNTVESTHRGLAAVVNINGDVVAHAGNTEQNVFARSTLKPLQAIPLLLHGGAERFGLEDRELSVICSSHGGQPFHLRLSPQFCARLVWTKRFWLAARMTPGTRKHPKH